MTGDDPRPGETKTTSELADKEVIKNPFRSRGIGAIAGVFVMPQTPGATISDFAYTDE